MKIKNAAIKAAIVLVPSYGAAFLTEKMVYVVPMLAASSFFAGTVDLSHKTTRRRVDEDEADDAEEEDDGEEVEEISIESISEATGG